MLGSPATTSPTAERPMFILGDESHHNGKVPWVTFSLVLINVLLFTVQCFVGEKFTNGFSLVPAEITEFRDITRTERVKVKEPVWDARGHVHYVDRYYPINHYPGPMPICLTLFTSMFLHADIFHII